MGGIRARGVIDLDFRQSHSLQKIHINMPNCRYYTFDHESGKFWRNINDQIIQTGVTRREQDQNLRFSINLAWDTTKDIDIQLAGVDYD